MINVTFSPIVSEYLKTLMLKKYRITDTGSSGVKKFLSQKIIELYCFLRLFHIKLHPYQLKNSIRMKEGWEGLQ